MSFDLFVWDPPMGARSDDDSVRARHERASEREPDDDEAAGESERIDAFFDALLAKYPHLDRIEESEVENSPWSVGPDRGDRWVSLCIRWSRSAEVAELVRGLAAAHRVVLYDPQSDVVMRG